MFEIILGVAVGAGLSYVFSAIFTGGGIISNSDTNEIHNTHLHNKYDSQFKDFKGSLDSDWYK